MKTLTTDQLRKMKAQNPDLALINVLPEKEFAEGHIPGSDNIPVDSADFPEKVARAAGGKDAKVVVYCASETCDASVRAITALENSGFKEVYDYEEGTRAWEEAGLHVASGGPA